MVRPHSSDSLRHLSRRQLFRRAGQVGLGAAVASAGCGTNGLAGLLPVSTQRIPIRPTPGDVAMLRFLAAAEVIEQDLWEQYCELATNNTGYREALEMIDEAMVRYICDNTDDERSH